VTPTCPAKGKVRSKVSGGVVDVACSQAAGHTGPHLWTILVRTSPEYPTTFSFDDELPSPTEMIYVQEHIQWRRGSLTIDAHASDARIPHGRDCLANASQEMFRLDTAARERCIRSAMRAGMAPTDCFTAREAYRAGAVNDWLLYHCDRETGIPRKVATVAWSASTDEPLGYRMGVTLSDDLRPYYEEELTRDCP
jgi:hypothetical protein